MSIRIVRLGSPRHKDEGTRIGTVRRPPRGVPKSRYASENWYDVWFPTLAPSLETMKLAQSATTPAQWKAFARKYRTELSQPAARHALDVLAALSRTSNFSVGCYCADESHCHRSILRALLTERGGAVSWRPARILPHRDLAARARRAHICSARRLRGSPPRRQTGTSRYRW